MSDNAFAGRRHTPMHGIGDSYALFRWRFPRTSQLSRLRRQPRTSVWRGRDGPRPNPPVPRTKPIGGRDGAQPNRMGEPLVARYVIFPIHVGSPSRRSSVTSSRTTARVVNPCSAVRCPEAKPNRWSLPETLSSADQWKRPLTNWPLYTMQSGSLGSSAR